MTLSIEALEEHENVIHVEVHEAVAALQPMLQILLSKCSISLDIQGFEEVIEIEVGLKGQFDLGGLDLALEHDHLP